MEIYEPYLLLFRECFHIRYPRIKSSFSLGASDFLILTVGRGTGEEKMKKNLRLQSRLQSKLVAT